jgi:hypothetical protein
MTPQFREDLGWYREIARLPLLGRRLCRQQGQHRRLVQPARPRRRLCRSPRLFLHPQRQGGAQPPVLRGGRHRRHHDRPRAHEGEGLRAFLGHRPPFARQPGVRLLGRPVGPGARALGRYRRAQRQRAAQPGRPARAERPLGRADPRPSSCTTRYGSRIPLGCPVPACGEPKATKQSRRDRRIHEIASLRSQDATFPRSTP